MPSRLPRIALVAFLLLGEAIRPSFGHGFLDAVTTVRLHPQRMKMVVNLSADLAAAALHDEQFGSITSANFSAAQSRLNTLAASFYEVAAPDGAALVPQSVETAWRPDEHIDFVLVYPSPPAGRLRFRAVSLTRLKPAFTGSLSVMDETGNSLGTKLQTAEDAALEIVVPSKDTPPDTPTPEVAGAPTPAVSAAAPKAAPQPPAVAHPSFWQFLKLGIEHILTGYDHLLFLCGLIVACRRLRSMLVIITSFTIAHSVTLGLAALDVVAMSPRVVEPLIAASIIFVGAENLIFGEGAKGRAWVALGFGLIHGFGFADALRQSGLGGRGAALLVPLFSFNLGVEIGQLTVAAIVLSLLFQARKIPILARSATVVISVLVVAAGGYWLLRRTVLA